MKKIMKKGFTLIELIVVIAIIAALMLILVPTMNGFVSTAKKQANQANAKAVYTAIVASETAEKAEIFKTSAGALKAYDAQACKSGSSDTANDSYTEFWAEKPVEDCVVNTDGSITVGTGTEKGTYPTDGVSS